MKTTAMFSIGALCVLAHAMAASAQDKPPAIALPQRYQPILKTPHTRLLQVYGSPEVQAGVGQTAVYAGKLAVFASNAPSADDQAPPSSQLLLWDLEKA